MVSYIQKRFQPSLLPEFLPDMDIVCFSAPHTPMTHKMINLSLIKKFKLNSYFINVSRGGCVDLDALVYGLEEKILAGVGIDVTDPEPLPKTHKLFSFNDVIITDHIAGLSEFNRSRSMELIKENIMRFTQGKTLINIVNKKSGY